MMFNGGRGDFGIANGYDTLQALCSIPSPVRGGSSTTWLKIRLDSFEGCKIVALVPLAHLYCCGGKADLKMRAQEALAGRIPEAMLV